ncbi:ribosomal-protein-alanine N-acetyltransferase [Flavobacterium sp. 90]|uniref:GNAT family N-acetyltransferase n=1 Tax=unclassified Flavobacterium TaxID=196869 RepID=UPI000EAE9CF1|nr:MULTISPECIES: GNAT family N-acetyltransferase [unclassified Flavobacterium]RKR09233.1 ribosomal-protein-alanine N-acetyltransferase [Flavobacterium sp. 81]TCK53017.1 ribosomal-protein-alanine N-acetyltransferase [Flavobacterium sp. 90]
MSILYQSSRIIIREFLPQEQQTFLDLFEDNQVTQYLPYASPERYLEMFNELLENYEKKNLSRWAIFDTTNNNFIGICVARIFIHNKTQIEIGYVLSREYWGKGIATEVCKAITQYAFANTDTKEVVAITDLDNTGSQNVLQKAGFERLNNLIRNEEEIAYFKIERSLV